MPIEIEAAEAASLVAVDDAVGIKHRNNLKDKIVSQKLSSHAVFLQKELNGPLNNIRANRLTWMSSRGKYHGLSFCDLAFGTLEICDEELWALISCGTLAEHSFSHEMRIFFCEDLSVEECHEICVGVGVAVGDINIISLMIEYHLKSQRGLESRSFCLRQMILKVLDIQPISVPANTARLRQSR